MSRVNPFEQILESLRGGEVIMNACAQSGVNIAAFFKKYKTDKKFRKAVESSQEVRVLMVDDVVYAMAIKRNLDAAEAYMHNHSNGKWESLRRKH
ncbi:MAG: hypothetical protein PHP45_03525 [Elusimicrobiales bacterium]|nr:hypothetical protein [Elusimicrobiales bacterium]